MIVNVSKFNHVTLNCVQANGAVEGVKGSAGGGEIVVPPAPETYTLSAVVSNGVVSALADGVSVGLPYTAYAGEVVVLEVTPSEGYTFEGWSDGVSDNPRTITMNGDVSLSAECVAVVVPPSKEYIQFADAEVERVLMANGVSSDGIGITTEDAEKVTSIGTWFRENSEITSFVELQHFVQVNILKSYGFYKCSALTSIGISNINELQDYALHTTGLTGEIEFPNVEIYGRNVLGGTSVTSLLLPKVKTISNGAFDGNKSLAKVDIGGDCVSIGNEAWRSDSALQQVIVRASTPPSLGSNAFQWTNSTFIIYVPDASLEAYRTATNWSAYAERIKPLSELNA